MDFDSVIRSIIGGKQAPQPPQGAPPQYEPMPAGPMPQFLKTSDSNGPGMAPPPPPSAQPSMTGYPGQPAPPRGFGQPPQSGLAVGQSPMTGLVTEPRPANPWLEGNPLASAQNAPKPAPTVGDALRSVFNYAPHVNAQFHGDDGGAPNPPMVPQTVALSPYEANQRLRGESLQPPPFAMSPATIAPSPFAAAAPVSSPNGAPLEVSMRAAGPQQNPLMPTYSAGAPTDDNRIAQINNLLKGQGPQAGHEILAAANRGTAFSDIAAGIPQLHQQELDSRRGPPGQLQNPYDGQWYDPGKVKSIGPGGVTAWSPAETHQLARAGNPQNGGAQLPQQMNDPFPQPQHRAGDFSNNGGGVIQLTPQARAADRQAEDAWTARQQGGGRQGGPAQGATAAQQPMSDRETALQSLPPQLAGLIRTGHFSRDQVAHMVSSFAPQMVHEHDPVWIGKKATADAISNMNVLSAHGVFEDRDGNISVNPAITQLPPDRLQALGVDPKGDVVAQLKNQYMVNKRARDSWASFFNNLIPLMSR